MGLLLSRLFPGPELGHNFRFALCIAFDKLVTKESLASILVFVLIPLFYLGFC